MRLRLYDIRLFERKAGIGSGRKHRRRRTPSLTLKAILQKSCCKTLATLCCPRLRVRTLRSEMLQIKFLFPLKEIQRNIGERRRLSLVFEIQSRCRVDTSNQKKLNLCQSQTATDRIVAHELAPADAAAICGQTEHSQTERCTVTRSSAPTAHQPRKCAFAGSMSRI